MAVENETIDLSFSAPLGVDPRKIHNLVRAAYRMGFETTVEIPDMEMPITSEMLAKHSPVVSTDSFIGKEHIVTYGREAKLSPLAPARLFNLLLKPYKKGWRGEPLNELFQSIGVVTITREQAGLPPLPEHLKSLNSFYCNDGEYVEAPSNAYAMTAGSLLLLSQRDEVLEILNDFGRARTTALRTITELAERDIQLFSNPTLFTGDVTPLTNQ